MCTTCGCSEPVKTHNHDNDHSHNHEHVKISVETDILAKNNLLAERNRGYFLAKNIFAVNMMSSPGSGKTTLLEKTILDLKGKFNIAVIEGDQQTENDAKRIRKTGAPAVQINTGSACHLDAHAVRHAVKELNPPDSSIIFVENVGNLVCPAAFDLGESKKIVILSITEGDDKPLKYPVMFRTSNLMIINKTDLLPYVEFDIDKSEEYARRINPKIETIRLSAKTGEGLNLWYGWIEKEMKIIAI